MDGKILTLITFFRLSSGLDGAEIGLAIRIVSSLGPKCPYIPIGLSSRDIASLTSSSENPVLLGFHSDSKSLPLANQRLLYRDTGCGLVVAENLSEVAVFENIFSKITYGLILSFSEPNASVDTGNSYLIDKTIIARRLARDLFLLEMPCNLSPKPSAKILWNVNDNDMNIPSLICSSTLQGHSVNVSVFAAFPYTRFDQQDGSFDGSDVRLLDIVAKKVGFSYTMFNDRTWIKNDENGQWGGMVGKILNGTTQFGLGPFGLNRPDHTLPLDFTSYLYSLEIIFLSPKPKPLSPILNFLKPFSMATWLCIMGAFLIGSLFSYFVGNATLDGRKTSVGNTLFVILATLLSQAITAISHRTPYSMFFIFWLAFVLLISASYDCNLRAYIIRVDFEKPIDNEIDLINADRDLYIPQGTSVDISYSLSPVARRQQIYQRSKARGTIFSYSKGIMDPEAEKRMIREGGARLYIKARASYGLSHVEETFGYQPLRMGKDILQQDLCAYMMPMFRPWKVEIVTVLMHLFDAGIVNHWIRTFVPVNKYSFRVKEDAAPPSAFKFDHIAGPLVLLLGGLIISSVVFAFEICYINSQKSS